MATAHPMQLGMIGLGRMGANLVRRLMRDGHAASSTTSTPTPCTALAGEGAAGADSLGGLRRQARQAPRAVWVMVPAGFVQDTVDQLAELLETDDMVIDGGNSYYRDDIAAGGAAEGAAASTTSTAAPAAACGGSSAATA